MLRTLLLTTALLITFSANAAEPVHGLAIYGAPKYANDYKNFDYVNPDAPKGGTFRMAALGTFDSLNPFIVKGVAGSESGMIYQTLLSGSSDEAFTEYGDVAATIEMPADRSFVTFNLHPDAKWHDGKPLTTADVVWSFNTLIAKGSPFYGAYYADVEKVTAESPTRVTFKFKRAGNRELPLIIGQLPILPEHYWKDKKFEETTLVPPLGSGPYKIVKVDAGRSVTLERVKDWWAKDLPINKGRYNFDTITIDYYRDAIVALEALFAGRYDFRQEYTAKVWATGYDVPQVKDGRIKKEEIKNGLPNGMQGFILNTRRPVFADRAVRQALQYAFDFEWANKAMAHSAYTRTASYFENSEFKSKGLPSAAELKLLEPFKDKLPADLFTKEFKNPATDGSGDARDNLREAMRILDEAGWTVGPDGTRTKNGVKLEFEIIENQPEFERWVLPFIRNLRRIGIIATFRVVDTAQIVQRTNDFDFDMTVSGFGQSNSPGNEQREFWGSDKADVKGSRNIIGIKNPAIDALVDKIAMADTKEDLKTAVSALDRVLLWNYYVIPQWYTPVWKVAYWNKFGRPQTQAPYALGVTDTWWVKK